jgi:hypothetical protein
MAVADRAGLGDIRQVIRTGMDDCNVVEREREVEPSLTRERVASLHRTSENGWAIVGGINSYDYAHVDAGADSLRIALGGTNPPDPATVRRVVSALLAQRGRLPEWVRAFEPADIRMLRRPPTAAHEVAAPDRGRPWDGSEIEVIVRQQHLVVSLIGDTLQILGAEGY